MAKRHTLSKWKNSMRKRRGWFGNNLKIRTKFRSDWLDSSPLFYQEDRLLASFLFSSNPYLLHHPCPVWKCQWRVRTLQIYLWPQGHRCLPVAGQVQLVKKVSPLGIMLCLIKTSKLYLVTFIYITEFCLLSLLVVFLPHNLYRLFSLACMIVSFTRDDLQTVHVLFCTSYVTSSLLVTVFSVYLLVTRQLMVRNKRYLDTKKQIISVLLSEKWETDGIRGVGNDSWKKREVVKF